MSRAVRGGRPGDREQSSAVIGIGLLQGDDLTSTQARVGREEHECEDLRRAFARTRDER